jgi:predicted mannosyl-3-phosphoglycerate phosphatase (HAD superfamily)
VCVSSSAAPFIRQVQQHLDIVEPFVCEGGAALYVPSLDSRVDAPAARVSYEWDVFRFNPPDRTAAVTLVRDWFVARGSEEPLTIGIGCDCDDYGVLSAVDLPIVVRDAVKDQSALLRHIPGAYVTKASGLAGWSEALTGGPP